MKVNFLQEALALEKYLLEKLDSSPLPNYSFCEVSEFDLFRLFVGFSVQIFQVQKGVFSIIYCLQTRIVQLPVGEHICRVQNINQADCNSVVTNYYQFGPANMYQDVIDDLMVVSFWKLYFVLFFLTSLLFVF